MYSTGDRPLRVLLTGNLNRWELAASYRRGFGGLGHNVELFDWYGRLDHFARRAFDRFSRLLLIAAARRRTAIDFLVRVRQMRPDLIVLLKTDDLPRGTIALARAAAPGCTIVAFHPDDPFNIRRVRGPSHPRAVSQIRAVDHYFIWSERIAQRIRRVSTTAVSYLGFACDPEFTRPIALSETDHARFDADISFVGNWAPKREAWLAPLARDAELRLAIWGESDWQNLARDPNVRASWRGLATGDDFVRAVLCSRASINILRPQNETAENMRTYEVPACGGVLLAEWSAQQSHVFRDGVEALYAKSPAELVERARFAVRISHEARSSLTAAALNRAMEQTYRTRAQTIIDTVGRRLASG